MTYEDCGFWLATGGCIPKSLMEGPPRPWWELALLALGMFALVCVLMFFAWRDQAKHPQRWIQDPRKRDAL